MYKCKYCDKECKNKNSLAQHEIRCKKNPNKINCDKSTNNLIKYNEKLKEGLVIKSNTNQYTKAKNLGLPKPMISTNTRKKLSSVWLGRKHSEESKQKTSMTMQRVVKEHPESYSAQNVGGRVKKVEYNGLLLDSTWEVIVAEYLDKHNIIWERPVIGFDYIYEDKSRTYYPDFYLPQYDVYIEVKGYKRQRDLIKWKVVSNLIVISKKEIAEIKSNIYQLPI